jgi:hypothetical protein
LSGWARAALRAPEIDGSSLEEESLMQRLILLVCAVTAATSLVVGCGTDSDNGASSSAGSSGTSGSSSSGGSAGSALDAQCVGDYSDLKHSGLTAGVTASGMCADAADVSSVCGNDVTMKAEGCGLDCLTMGATDMDGCVATCLGTQVTPALSAGCTSCYVTDVGCARDNCLLKCATPSSTACAMCRQQFGCIDAFYSCSGLPVPGSSSDGTGGAGDTASAGAGG